MSGHDEEDRADHSERLVPPFPSGYPIIFDDWMPYIPVASRFKIFENGVWRVSPAIPLALRVLGGFETGDICHSPYNRSEHQPRQKDRRLRELETSQTVQDTAESGAHTSDIEPSNTTRQP